MLRFAAFLLFLSAALPALGAEEILRFDSLVEVDTGGDYTVTETIQVRAEGREIRRGIYRDIPLIFEDADGRRRRNALALISATRDGASEPWRIQEYSGYARLYLGDANVVLSPGVYTYELTYVTDRQVRFFEDHDEVYWNATGTEWDFPIREATARVVLPEDAVVLNSAAFTGGFGSTESNASSMPSPGGVTFRTTAPLGPREGLTILVGLSKGVVTAPSAAQRRAWFLRDNLGAIIAVTGAALVFAYYTLVWWLVGRDPRRGVMIPRWDAPDDLSPALTHYIWNHGVKGDGFPAISAAVLNLAVHGAVTLHGIGGTITLRRTEKPVERAAQPVGERAVLAAFSGYGASLTISEEQGKKVASLGSAFRRAMEAEHRGVFYKANLGWVFLGLALSALAVIATIGLGSPKASTFSVLIPMIFCSAITTIIILNAAKQAGIGLADKLRLVFVIFFLVVTILNLGTWALSGVLSSLEEPVLIGALATLVLINLFFFFLIGAPTQVGQKRRDEIAGLRHYLS
ncbi:MAG: DUF2207 domain-containing protein, partial [Pseudomonadota bacterium]